MNVIAPHFIDINNRRSSYDIAEEWLIDEKDAHEMWLESNWLKIYKIEYLLAPICIEYKD